jgi:hypothetical protein
MMTAVNGTRGIELARATQATINPDGQSTW